MYEIREGVDIGGRGGEGAKEIGLRGHRQPSCGCLSGCLGVSGWSALLLVLRPGGVGRGLRGGGKDEPAWVQGQPQDRKC